MVALLTVDPRKLGSVTGFLTRGEIDRSRDLESVIHIRRMGSCEVLEDGWSGGGL
jgi:hypothetical protein